MVEFDKIPFLGATQYNNGVTGSARTPFIQAIAVIKNKVSIRMETL